MPINNMNDPKAQNDYGIFLQDDKNNNKPDLIKGVEYLKKSAEQGNIYGMSNYGVALNNGYGVKKDHKKAEEYLKKSADAGLADAQVNYGYILMFNNKTPERIEEGLKYIRKAMDKNLPEAFCTYAYILKEGVYLEKNNEQSMIFFKEAADLGNDDAMVEYAIGNEIGIGVPQNIEIAKEYYQLAALKGNEIGKARIKELTQNNNQNPNSSLKLSKKSKKSISKKKSFSSSSSSTPSSLNNQSINIDKEEDDDENHKSKLNINLPLQVSPNMKIISLGEVVYDRPKYHTENYIYPVGYQIEREYYSIDDPNKYAIYRATILDGGDSPLFQVECLDKSKKVFKGESCSGPWVAANIEVNKARVEKIIDSYDKTGLSGPLLFGLVFDRVKYMISHLPNASKCANYFIPKLFVRGVDDEIEGGKEIVFFNYHQKQKEPKNKKKIKIKKEEKNRREKLKTNQIENVDLNDDDNSQFSQNDEMSSQFSQIIFNFNKPVEELVQIGDELSAQNDPTSAFRYYKEAANRGYSEAYLKCAEVSLSIEDIILLLENKKVLKKIEEGEIDRHQMIEYLNNSRVKKINSS